MPNITKPNNINTIWAATGDIAAPSNEYVANGWESIIPPREYFNWLDNRQDRFNAHVNQHGIPVWDSTTEYQAGLSYTKGSNGTIYKALTTNSNVNPVTDTTGAWSLAFSRPSGSKRFTSNGTFVVPAGVTTLYVSGCGGGGGGGGGGGSTGNNGTGGGGGGGAGNSAIKQPYTVVPGASIAITIGVAGAAGTSSSGNGGNGGNGGSTTVGSLVSLSGGSGGVAGTTTTGAGGAGGEPGGQWGGDAQSPAFGGNGGSGAGGPFGTGGGGGRAGSNTIVSSGTTAIGFGVGGAGGGGNYSPTSGRPGATGTAGRPGLVIIEW